MHVYQCKRVDYTLANFIFITKTIGSSNIFRIGIYIASVAFLVCFNGWAAANAAHDAYRLESDDRVRVTVFGHQDLSGEFEVDGAGFVSLPLIQFVQAAGKTTQELEQAITAKLKPNYLKHPRVSVEVLSYRPIYIIGEVRNPGSYPYINDMKVINVVALAGGYTYRAAKKKIKIIRADDPSKRKQKASEDSVVHPGDIVEVYERLF